MLSSILRDIILAFYQLLLFAISFSYVAIRHSVPGTRNKE